MLRFYYSESSLWHGKLSFQEVVCAQLSDSVKPISYSLPYPSCPNSKPEHL